MHLSIDTAAYGTLFGVALNDQDLFDSLLPTFHQAPYKQPPTHPVLFIKTPNTRNHHGGQVARPMGERLQPGPALGVVMGKAASRVTAQDALAYVAGYTIVNEFSLPEDSYYRPAIKAKCRDGFCALGPNVTPVAAISNPQALGIRLFVNGHIRQQGSTARQVRSAAVLIAQLSTFMTLNAGDVLITGTPPGRVDVRPGDTVAVEIDGLGRLENTVIEEI